MVLPFFHIAVNLRLYKSLSSVIYYSVKVIVQNRQKHGVSLTAIDSLPLLIVIVRRMFPEVNDLHKKEECPLN